MAIQTKAQKAAAKIAKAAATKRAKEMRIMVTAAAKTGNFTRYDMAKAFEMFKATESRKDIRDTAVKYQEKAARAFTRSQNADAINKVTAKVKRAAKAEEISVIVTDSNSLAQVKIDGSGKAAIANFRNYGDKDISVDYDAVIEAVIETIVKVIPAEMASEIYGAYTVANLPVYVKHAIQQAIKVIANSENGFKIYKPTILKAIGDSLIQLELLHRIGEELDGDLKEIDKVEKAYNSIFAKAKASYLTAKLANIKGIEAEKDENGYAVVKSPVSKAAGTKLASIILSSFVKVQDILALTQHINKQGNTQVAYSINPVIMASAIDKVIREGSTLRSQAIFIDTPPEIDKDFSIGNKFDIIGDKVSMVVGGSENSYGDTSVIVESLNNLTRTELVIDTDFLDINLEITQKLIEIANRK